MSALEGKADMTVGGNPLSRSLLGVKRTSPFATHMSASDPKRTSGSAKLGGRMQRREVVTLLGSMVMAWPLAAHAQQAERVRRVGVLMPFAVNDREAQARNAVFVQSLQQLGWTIGRDLQIDYRWS